MLRSVRGRESGTGEITCLIIPFICCTVHKIMPVLFNYYYYHVKSTCGTMGEKRGVYRVMVGKLEGKTPLGRSRRRWVDNSF